MVSKHVFSRKKYEDLLHNLHCASSIPPGQPGHDKIHKIRKVVTILNRNFQKNWTPHQQNSVNEGMFPFKGRIGFKQYMKDKPTMWGIKVWKVVDSVMAYLLHFSIYTGKTDNPGANLGELSFIFILHFQGIFPGDCSLITFIQVYL